MSSKRQATSNLNHENWDQEEEPEERGTFKTATAEELKTRVIKKATRRKADTGISDADDSAPKASNSVFSGFSGFGKPAAPSAIGAGSPFAFLSNLTSSDSAKKPSASASPSADKADGKWTAPAKMFAFDAKPMSESTSKAVTSGSNAPTTSIFGTTSASDAMKPMLKSAVSVDKPATGSSLTVSNEYRESVAELNIAVMKFLQEHMDKTPYWFFTPVFDSYNRYLKELQQDNGIKNATPTTSASVSFSCGKPTSTIEAGSTSPSTALGRKPNCTVTSGGTTMTSTAPQFSFGTVQKSSTSTSSEVTSSTSASTTSFSFGAKPATTVAAKTDAPTSFSFGAKPATAVAKTDGTSTASPTTSFIFVAKPSTSLGQTDATAKPSFFSFANKEAASTDEAAPASATSTPKTNGFSFGLKTDDKPGLSGFSGFGKPASETAASSGFSFASPSTAFSFGNVKPPTAAAIEAAEGNAEDEDDTPPKAEFNKVVEDDATFSKRCKVFVKKDKDFTERGVGTLYLKPVKDSDKTQMLVRADTNLGNILINLILSKGLPSQRMGKNNVIMVCIPTPDETNAMSILLRVKTGEEADELLEQIKTHSV